MSGDRGKLLQTLLQKMAHVFRSMHVSMGFSFKKCQISKTQAHIIFLVAQVKSGLAVKDLAKALKVTSGAVTQLVDELVAKGMVKRDEDSEDKRILRIKFTESTKKHFDAFKKSYFKAVNPMFASLTNTEIKQLINLMEKIKLS